MTTHSTAPTDPRTDRERVLDDMAALIEWLRAHPDVPVARWDAEISHGVNVDDDADGITEIERIAAQCGVPVTSTGGRPATDADTHLHATYQVGEASYEATYITRARMDAHYALVTYADNVQGGA